METAFRLFLVSLLPWAVSVVMYYLEKRTSLRIFPIKIKQIICGVIFGVVSILGTVLGVELDGATANVRDAGVLCAGLFFGAEAGIIAGLIGGVHRWLASPWAGEYSKIACSLATIIAGFYAAALRNYMFDKRRPNWMISGLVAVVVEVFHLILLYITHFDDVHRVFTIIQVATFPMLFANAFALSLTAASIDLLSLYNHEGRKKKILLAERIQRWLLLAIVVVYVCTTLFLYVMQTSTSVSSAVSLLTTNINDVESDIRKRSEEHMLETTRLISARYESDNGNNARLPLYATIYHADEINVVNRNGIIVSSTEADNVGYNLNEDPLLYSFDCLNDGTRDYVQQVARHGTVSQIGKDIYKYAGTSMRLGGYILVGFSENAFRQELEQDISDIIRNRRVGQTGYIMVTNSKGTILGEEANVSGRTIAGVDEYKKQYEPYDVIITTDGSEKVFCMYDKSDGFYVIAVLPAAEIFASRDESLYMYSFMEVIAFALLFALIFFLIKGIVVNDIQKINQSLAKIISGDYEEKINVDSTLEMTALSGYINSTVSSLKSSISEVKDRMEKDLHLAANIQNSALPTMFPPYPDIKDFDIYALMDPAREVGGDFYDFFLLTDHRLAFMVADVSGKGIPAAMFMMRARTIFKSLIETGMNPENVVYQVNNKLCSENDSGMFVTAWFGILDYETGVVNYVNAGHNPPLVGRKGLGFTYLRTKPGLVLAGMEEVPYKTMSVTLEPGDRLFVYTDGVVEATSINKELYGENRLMDYLNDHQEDPIDKVPAGVMADIDEFIQGAEQFDDITMLLLQYNGPQKEPEVVAQQQQPETEGKTENA